MNVPKPGGEFEWMPETWGPVLRCVPLLKIAPHFFTTRALQFAVRDTLSADWKELARMANVELDALVRLRQVHGARVVEASSATSQAAEYDRWPEADVAVTNDPYVALTVRAADCVPILLASRASGVVAAVHTGWRGTAAGAAATAVAAMRARFNADPGTITAAIGPSIGVCCYQVGEELVRAFQQGGHDPSAIERWFRRDGALRLDLWSANRDQLEAAGLGPQNIHVAALCTASHPEVFHSYRRDGPAAGRMAAVIRARVGSQAQDSGFGIRSR